MQTFTKEKTITKLSRQVYTGDKSAYEEVPYSGVTPNIFVSGFIVSGIYGATNGTYLYMGLLNGKPYYKKGIYYIFWNSLQGAWSLCGTSLDMTSGVLANYFSNENVANPTLVTSWSSGQLYQPSGTVVFETAYRTCYLRPLNEEESASNGVQFGLGFQIIVECDVDIREGDKVNISNTLPLTFTPTGNMVAQNYENAGTNGLWELAPTLYDGKPFYTKGTDFMYFDGTYLLWVLDAPVKVSPIQYPPAKYRATVNVATPDLVTGLWVQTVGGFSNGSVRAETEITNTTEYTIRGIANHDRGGITKYKRALALKSEKQ